MWVFVWTINDAKIDPLSQNLDMFLKQIIFVRTPKIMMILQILFTGPHQNFFKSFLSHYFSMADSMRAPISIILFLLKSLVFNTFQQSWKVFINSVCLFVCSLVFANTFQMPWNSCMLLRFAECFEMKMVHIGFHVH